MVDEKTGELNIKIRYPNWDPQKHYLISLLTHLKKIFYVKSFDKIVWFAVRWSWSIVWMIAHVVVFTVCALFE